MKTFTNSFKILIPLLAMTTGLAFSQVQTSRGQSKEQSIHIELRQDENGEAKTFKKDYGSRQEMLGDQDLKAFLKDQDLNVHFYGGKDKGGTGTHEFSFPHSDEKQVHFFSDTDSLHSFHFSGPGSFQFKGMDGDNTYLFNLPGDADKSVWLFDGGDSLLSKKLLPFDLDSMRIHFKNQFDKGDKGAYFFEWESEGDGGQQSTIVLRKKVTISKIEENELALDLHVSNKMSMLNPLDISYYPNPNNGRFTLKMTLKSTAPVQVSVSDLSGK